MLRTDYKDAMFDGARKYKITQNTDGTSGITDETEYTQEGDSFGANDINATNAAVNRMNHITWVTLKASEWAGSAAPYTQTVAVAGLTAEDDVMLVSGLADGASVETIKAYNKAFGIVASTPGVTADGSATFKAYKKPETDIRVGLKGV